jgi:eukaryotic-like serine/threonine-protein kinase
MNASSLLDEAAIFNEARQIATPEARRQYVRAACADDEQRCARIEALLRIHREEQTFLEEPVVPRPAPAMIREGPGTLVGPYKLQEQIGEGGFGVVFRAEQQPLRRAVAVKILKPGLDTHQIVARFEAERQALALMDHPSIAHVLDGGETAYGRPFFVMDLVDGIPITPYCDAHQLGLRERLTLFIEVCQAVQHAHQKGIIHRDLKPSNVLVGSMNGKPVAKLIDFGVAKALGQRLTESTLVTGVGSVVGTLEYMSPEQAEFHAVDIDTRADIYSLGVLLYELLTGTTPLTHDRIKDAAITEILRLIREEDPPRPSIRLSGSKESARATKEMRGDLDWIVMKALEKDRDRRYASAGDFAQDLQRFLAGEAILARPPSALYRMRKFVQRHRGAMAAATAVTLALVVGTVVATWQAIEATRAQEDAWEAAAAESKAKIAAAAKEAETQAVLKFMLNHVFAAARPEGRPGGLGPDVKLRRALEAALPAVEKSFAKQPLVEARLRMTLGTSFRFLGDHKTSAAQYARARALYTAELGPDHVDTLESMNNLANAWSSLDYHEDALKLRQETLARRRATLGPDHTETLLSMRNLANSYADMNRLEEALQLEEETLPRVKAKLGPTHPETLACMNNLALTYTALKRYEDAAMLQEETLQLYKTNVGPDHLDTLTAMNNLANSYADLHRYPDALKLREETLALHQAKLGADHLDTVRCVYNLANIYGSTGQYAKALELHAAALEVRQLKLGPNHRETLWSMWGVAANLMKLERGAEAVPIIDDVLERAAKLKVQPNLLGLANLRIKYFAKANDADGCRATAELWEKLKRTDPSSLFNAACYRAVTAKVLREAGTSPGAAKQEQAEADKAMAWLHQAVTAGYANLGNIKDDTDLDALRGRDDFRALVAELEAGKGKK